MIYNYSGSLTSNFSERFDGIYCGICGMKTYLSADGSHRRCSNCDDL